MMLLGVPLFAGVATWLLFARQAPQVGVLAFFAPAFVISGATRFLVAIGVYFNLLPRLGFYGDIAAIVLPLVYGLTIATWRHASGPGSRDRRLKRVRAFAAMTCIVIAAGAVYFIVQTTHSNWSNHAPAAGAAFAFLVFATFVGMRDRDVAIGSLLFIAGMFAVVPVVQAAMIATVAIARFRAAIYL